MKRVIFFISFVCLISITSIVFAGKKEEFIELKCKLTVENWEEIKKNFNKYDPDDRIRKIIDRLDDLPVSAKEKAEFLYNAMIDEIKNPSKIWTKYCGDTWYRRYRYALEIGRLGEEGRKELYKYYNNVKTDEERELLTIALVEAKDLSYLDEMWYIVKYSKNDHYRSYALGVIHYNHLYRPVDIPDLKTLLKDPYCYTKPLYTCLPNEELPCIGCPLRDYAAEALRNMGVKVKRDKNNYIIEEE